MDIRLKYAIDHVLDAFDDALLNTPGRDASERTAMLLNHVLPMLIERGEKFKAIDPNPDLDARAKAELMTLLGRVMQSTENISAVIVLRLLNDGHVLASGGSKNLRDGAVDEMAIICRMALSELAKVRIQPQLPMPRLPCWPRHAGAGRTKG